MSLRFASITALVLLLTVTASRAEPETVSIRTADGLTLAGDLYPSGAKGAPGVVALHMYGQDRTTWAPVAERFAAAGIDFLAIDMRGHGASAVQGDEDLAPRVKARDGKLFAAMYQDALAAAALLVSRGTDRERIGLLGASVGCSVAIDAAKRMENVRGVCVMTPGEKYLGIPTMEHLAGYGKRPMLILSSEEEAKAGATAIAAALGRTADLRLFPQKKVHGTRMFGKVEGVERIVVDWFRTLLGAPVAMDGKLAKAEAEGATLVTVPYGEGKLEIRLAWRGAWVHAALTPIGAPVPYEMDFAWTTTPAGKDARSIFFGGDSCTFTYRISKDREWTTIRRRKAAHAADPSGAKGEVIEMIVPAGDPGVGLDADPRLKILIFARGEKADGRSDWIPLPPGR